MNSASSSSMSIKASSLGNFDIITTKDESIDQISISSMNSETSRKKEKEKQWLETYLDGPLIRSKSTSSSSEAGSRSLPHPTYNSIATVASNHHYTLSPTFNSYNLHTTTSHHAHHHPHKYHKYGNRSKLSSQSMSSNTYRPSVTKLEDQIYLSQSTSVLDNTNISNNTDCQGSLISNIPQSADLHQYSKKIHQHHSALSGKLSPDINGIVNSSKYNTLKVARSPIIANINKTSDIRIESPKNMTVIQPATFMPYKEITKPFEMSDFYKYSTKFRQKEGNPQQHQQQQQQRLRATAVSSVVADAN